MSTFVLDLRFSIEGNQMSRGSIHASVSVGAVAAMLMAGLTVSSAASAASAPADDESLAALESVAPAVLAGASGLQETQSGDLVAHTVGGTVTVPEDSNAPVTLSSNGVEVDINLPVEGATVISHDDGAATYSEVDGVSTVVSAQEASGVVIATVLNDESASARFAYEYVGIDLELTGEGDVIGYDAAGEVAVIVAMPWAYDATGREVPTHYEVAGSVLTQVVDHASGSYAYPIVADPTSYGGNDLYRDIVVDADSRGTLLRVYPQSLNFSHISNSTIWSRYQALTPGTLFEQTTMYDQLICHVRNVGLLKVPWNLEPWRPNVGYVAVVAAGCNP